MFAFLYIAWIRKSLKKVKNPFWLGIMALGEEFLYNRDAGVKKAVSLLVRIAAVSFPFIEQASGQAGERRSAWDEQNSGERWGGGRVSPSPPTPYFLHSLAVLSPSRAKGGPHIKKTGNARTLQGPKSGLGNSWGLQLQKLHSGTVILCAQQPHQG